MTKFLNKNFKINLILIAVFVIIILIVLFTGMIKIDSTINSLFPNDKQLRLSVDISQKSPNAQKIIIYTEVDDENKLLNSINLVKKTINESRINFTNIIPNSNDILSLLEYAENNSLLLYPYESKENPFTDEQIKKRFDNKFIYLNSSPFLTGNSFLNDPLMFAPEILKQIEESSGNKYTPKYGGVISNDGKSYIQIFKSDFGNEDYKKVKELKKLDNQLKKISKKEGFNSFIYCAHFYFLESKTKITNDIAIIFIFTTFFVILIFYLFFKKIHLVIYTSMPIIGGYAVTLLLISFIKPNFGGISLSFGATVIGITIDYIINFISRRNYYSSLKETRKKIGLSLLMALLTTLASFVFLFFSRIESLIEIAIFGLISITSVYLISWFILQPLLPQDTDLKERLILKIPLINNKIMFLIWIAITLFTFIFIPIMKFEDNIVNLDMNHKELEKRKNILLEIFKESNDNIFLAFTGNSRDEIFEKSLNALNVIHKESKDNSFVTPALFIPPKNIIEQRKKFIKENFNKNIFLKNLENSDFTMDSFDQWLNNIKNIDKLEISEMPEFFKNQYDSMFINIQDKEYLLIHIYKRSKSNEIKNILKKNNVDFNIVDIIEDSKNGLITFEKKSLLLLSISLILIFLLITFSFKNLLYGIIGTLPGITGLLSCLTVAYFTNNGFNLMHFVSCVLIIGIGVDYGIFMINVYKNKLNEEEFYLTAQSLLICCLTTIAGFGALAISSNYSIFSIGSTMLAGIISAIFTTYYAIPFILTKLTKYDFKVKK